MYWDVRTIYSYNRWLLKGFLIFSIDWKWGFCSISQHADIFEIARCTRITILIPQNKSKSIKKYCQSAYFKPYQWALKVLLSNTLLLTNKLQAITLKRNVPTQIPCDCNNTMETVSQCHSLVDLMIFFNKRDIVVRRWQRQIDYDLHFG